MANKITKGKWVARISSYKDYASVDVMTNQENTALALFYQTTENEEEFQEQRANAIAISKVPEMIDLLQSLQILQEQKMLCHDMRITQDTMAKVDLILKELKDE